VGVLVTRPAHQAEKLCRLIEAAGGHAIPWPLLEIKDPDDLGPARQVIQDLGQFQMAIFISANAVERGFRLIREAGNSLDDIQVVAVGKGTARRLAMFGIAHPLVPESDFSTEGLLALDTLRADRIDGQRVAIFRGVGGRELLGETLRARGAVVEYAEVYQRVKPSADPKNLIALLEQGQIDIIVVTSPEGLRNLFEMTGSRGWEQVLRTPLMVFGARMAAEARSLGSSPIVIRDASDEGIMDGLLAWRAATQTNQERGES
jgi:uroporphyrinogen-III synthase